MNSWISLPLTHAFARTAIGAGGVYLVARVRRVLGLPAQFEPLYVGRTLRGFRQRLLEHANPWTAHNSGLHAELNAAQTEDLELWLLELGPAEARAAERELIRSLNPTLNRIRYKEKSNDN